MKVVEAIYEDGVLKLVKPEKIDNDVVMVKILNRDEVLTEEDMKDILEALSEREKGNYYKMEEVFDV
ncbi:hypothetical protein DRP05_07100 [Archaeoglobales archaeon]|nr:MAG: hypothetical protein DRP05_07100 [Archaeoglobales archaeon]